MKATLWFRWHAHMHNSLTHRSHSPSNSEEEFLLKILKLRDFFAFYASGKFTLFTQRNNTTSPKIERKRVKKPLTRWKSDFKLRFYLVTHYSKNIWAVFIPFYVKKYRTENNVIKWSSNINKLLRQRCKNRPEIKASVLCIILGTITDNLWELGLNLFSYKKQKH